MVHRGLMILAFVAVRMELVRADENYPSSTEIDESSMNICNISLSMDGQQLKSLDHQFIESEYLTHLNLENNNIETISPLAFNNIPRLSHLNLENNLIRNIDLLVFCGAKNLERLNLNGNCKQSVSEIQDSYETTDNHFFDEYGQWRPSPWSTMSPAVRSCEASLSGIHPKLSTLYLKRNNLKRLNVNRIGMLPRLTHLDLSDNFIKFDSEMMSDLNDKAPSLSILVIKNSLIAEFDASQLPSLTELFLDQNRILHICNEYCDVLSLKLKYAVYLKVLSVSRNEISKIESDSFNYTTNLITLDLSHNNIREIREGTFDKLHHLRNLHLEFNGIVKLNALDSFRGLIELDHLFVGKNKLSNISENAFKNLTKLKTLMLEHNEISVIDSGMFYNLRNLQEISLAGNQLSSLPERCLPDSGSLVFINLDNNRLTDTEYIFIPDSPNLITLSLKGNPLGTMKLPWHSNSSTNLSIILENTCDSKKTILVPRDQ